jgi:hypothetical protein
MRGTPTVTRRWRILCLGKTRVCSEGSYSSGRPPEAVVNTDRQRCSQQGCKMISPEAPSGDQAARAASPTRPKRGGATGGAAALCRDPARATGNYRHDQNDRARGPATVGRPTRCSITDAIPEIGKVAPIPQHVMCRSRIVAARNSRSRHKFRVIRNEFTSGSIGLGAVLLDASKYQRHDSSVSRCVMSAETDYYTSFLSSPYNCR